jgi:CHAT domain-containing protein/tetratricopeptide (TPR) repeat protein
MWALLILAIYTFPTAVVEGRLSAGTPLRVQQTGACCGAKAPIQSAPVGRSIKASELFQARRYQDLIGLSQARYRESLERGESEAAIKWLNNLAGAYFALMQYRRAMQVYVEARALAESTGGWEHVAAINANLSSLYLQAGEMNAAAESAEAAIRGVEKAHAQRYHAQLLIQLGRLQFRRGEREKGIASYRGGIEEAAARGDWVTEARGWDHLGWELLLERDLAGAERALVEAYRLRRLHRSDDLALSYPKLGLLRLAQGDLRSADVLLDLAVQANRRETSLVPLWSVYYHRGGLRLAQGRLSEAWSDYGTALDLARKWKIEVLPVEAVRNSAAVGLEELTAAFVETGSRLYFRERRADVARVTLAAAEESRAWSLRASLDEPGELQQRLPPSYWEALAQLQSAEVALLRGAEVAERRRASLLRAKLTEMEAEAGVGLPARGSEEGAKSTECLIAEMQARLKPDEALMSFHLAEPESSLWIVTRAGVCLERLGSGSRLREAGVRFRDAVEHGAMPAAVEGEQLYAELFGKLRPEARRRRYWILALDEPLFGIPWAALVCARSGSEPVYLAERHVVRVVPSALHVGLQTGFKRVDGFVGVGDPIYNAADGRAPQRRKDWGLFSFLPVARTKTAPGPALELSRLVGGAKELEGCTQMLGGAEGTVRLLTGSAVTRERLRRELARNPAMVHFAVHVLTSAARPQEVVLALSLRPEGRMDWLTPREIGTWRHDLGLVTLNACDSGVNPNLDEAEAVSRAIRYNPLGARREGADLRGAGVLGLGRAWLKAGARAVVVSHWATPDSRGEIFLRFYPYFVGHDGESGWGRRAAAALDAAQVAMLRSAGWQARPAYWAAYYVIGKD